MGIKKTTTKQTYEVKNEKYAIVATATYEYGGEVKAINGGIVRTEDKTVATFEIQPSRFGGVISNESKPTAKLIDYLSVNYSGVDSSTHKAILDEISAFVAAVEADVKSVTL